ncbi:MAG: hypothetical protein NTV54_00470 [Ignavibacteriales bacterium]|nr:hypothetical protein [Ignavibacteriales bacterium]
MGFIFPFLLMFSSCDLLQTRAPEEPQGEKTTLPPATTAEIAVANFQTALQQNDAQEYLRLFSDSTQGGMRYTFLPARTAGISYATLFSRWTRESERDWMLNIATHLTAGTSPRLVLEPSRLTPFQADSALLEATYSLSIPHQDAALPKLFTGTMYLMLAPNRNTGLWTIFRWEDVETRKDSSWSMAKGYFGR